MKRVLTSASILALGATTIHAYDPEMSRQQTGGPFSVAATVRGFYDDNINTSPDKVVVVTPAGPRKIDPREGSFGLSVSPSAHLNLPMEQTFLSLGYVYTLSWYENRARNQIDQAHEFSAKLRHQFSPRQQIGVDDSFVITSEPTVADNFGIVTSPVKQRGRSSVFRNHGAIDYNLGLTRLLALNLGYGNNWYDYEEEGLGSRSALLDRIEHSIRADGRLMFTPKLVGVVGYTFGWTDFQADELIVRSTAKNPTLLYSDDRNNYSHRGYVGADYDVTAKVRLSARVGAEYTEYSKLDESSINPYADASISYSFRAGSSLEVGVRHHRNSTDVAAVDGEGHPTLDAETTAVFAHLEHRLTRDLTASLNGIYQHSTFNDGVNNGQVDDFWMAGINFAYTFNRHLSAEIGYNYDLLDSNVKPQVRSYDRNRYYIGVTARY